MNEKVNMFALENVGTNIQLKTIENCDEERNQHTNIVLQDLDGQSFFEETFIEIVKLKYI